MSNSKIITSNLSFIKSLLSLTARKVSQMRNKYFVSNFEQFNYKGEETFARQQVFCDIRD